MPLAEVTVLGRRDQDPATARETTEHDDLSPPWSQEERSIGRNVGPVQRKVQEAHSSESGADKVGYCVVRCHPAEEGQRSEHREDVLGQELPHGHAEKSPEEDSRLLARRSRRSLALFLLRLEQGGLAKRREPRELRIVDEELSSQRGKRVASPHNTPHEENRRCWVNL